MVRSSFLLKAVIGLLLAIFSCNNFCRKQFYTGGFDSPHSRYCYCFEALEKATPLPMPISLIWYGGSIQEDPYEQPEEDYIPRRKSFFRYDLGDE